MKKLHGALTIFIKRLLDLQPQIQRKEIFFLSLTGTKTSRDVAQLGSVLAWGARGRRFKSCHPDTDYQTLTIYFVSVFFV